MYIDILDIIHTLCRYIVDISTWEDVVLRVLYLGEDLPGQRQHGAQLPAHHRPHSQPVAGAELSPSLGRYVVDTYFADVVDICRCCRYFVNMTNV